MRFKILDMKLLSLIIGGASGTVARYIFSGAIHRVAGASFPYGTLVVNLVGCFLLGFLATIAQEKFLLGTNARLFLMIGFCGAFTTFSTFMLETFTVIRGGESLRAFLNVSLSVMLGFLLLRIGVFFAEVI